jgi:hypothetical protein
MFAPHVKFSYHKVLFGEFAKLVGNGTVDLQGEGSVADGFLSKTSSDLVNRAVRDQTGATFLRTGPAAVILQPKREFQLQRGVLLQV